MHNRQKRKNVKIGEYMEEFINIEKLENLNKNKKISEITKDIIADYQQQKYDTCYEKCKLLLEKINATLLLKLQIKIKNYNIFEINRKYEQIDNSLYEEMKDIILKYREIEDEGEASKYNIEILILKIDDIYGHMISKYGNFMEQ